MRGASWPVVVKAYFIRYEICAISKSAQGSLESTCPVCALGQEQFMWIQADKTCLVRHDSESYDIGCVASDDTDRRWSKSTVVTRLERKTSRACGWDGKEQICTSKLRRIIRSAIDPTMVQSDESLILG